MIGVEVEGIDEFVKKFGGAVSLDVLYGPMERALVILLNDIATYPPQRPSNVEPGGYFEPYERTGTLGRTWAMGPIVLAQDGVEGSIGNNTDYGPYVQDAERQAAVHQGYWPTDAEVGARHQQEISDMFAQAIENYLG